MRALLPDSPVAIFDLDGTLADVTHRRHLVECPKAEQQWDAFYAACVDDSPVDALIDVMEALYNAGWAIWIFSGRSEDVRPETVRWLTQHGCLYDLLVMRPTKDYTPDEELKLVWLKKFGKQNVRVVYDDRDKVVAMWRAQGLLCCQVAPGNF